MKNLRRRFELFCYHNREKGIPNLMLYVSLGCALVYLITSITQSNILYSLLVFDRNAGFKESDYRKLAQLCEGHEVYICDAGLANKDLGIDNVTVVDLYGLLKEHEEYLMADKIHLSPDGSKAMADLLFKVVK